MHIKTHRDHQPLPLRQFAAEVRRRKRMPGPLPETIAEAPIIQARVNHGNWIADCPFCAGAELVDPTDLRFWCLSCDMSANGGQWLPVAVPAMRAEIETALVIRPRAENRNWFPHETPADLRSENARNGVR